MNKKLFVWLCVIGGVLWGIKPIYDGLVIGRKMNTGYIPSDPTDYIKFIFPFLCLGALFIIGTYYKKVVRSSVIVLTLGVILSGLFHFSEIYLYGSNLPFGLLFLFSGTILLLMGALMMYIQLRKIKSRNRLLSLSVFILFLDNLLLVVLAFLSEAIEQKVLEPFMFTQMIVVGWIWAVIGLSLLKLEQITNEQKTGM